MRFRGCVVDFRGDWQWFKQIFGVAGWKVDNPNLQVCFKCRCTVGNMDDFGPTAQWRQTFYTPASYLQEAVSPHSGLNLDPLNYVPGFTWMNMIPEKNPNQNLFWGYGAIGLWGYRAIGR